MTKLDLHNIRHGEAARLVECTINKLWCSEEELHIVTGHSQKMKEIVIDILDEYKLEYSIGDYQGINTGFIKTYLD